MIRGLLNLNTSGTTGVLAMQRQMKEMQDEIKRLRKSTGNRAKNLPLSEAEKIVLVNSLSKLSINQHVKLWILYVQHYLLVVNYKKMVMNI